MYLPLNLLAKGVFILGISNLIFLSLVLLTCRCTLSNFSKMLWKYNWYKKLYEHHCIFWKLFLLSVFLHAVLAIVNYGNPF